MSVQRPKSASGKRVQLGLFGVLLAAVAAFAWNDGQVATVKPLRSAPVQYTAFMQQREQEGLDAPEYVDRIWQDVVRTVRERAVDLTILLAELQADPEAAGTRYGYREGSRAFTFMVAGSGRVLSVDTESLTGRAFVDLAPYDGEADATIQIGPVVRGNALRDGLPIIRSDEFTNQLEYASVGRELNRRAIASALGGIDVGTLPGKHIRFYGAFSLGAEVLITPVELHVMED